ncbi:MAG: hypothetical protein WBX19_22265 [Terracidiphilus sp.]
MSWINESDLQATTSLFASAQMPSSALIDKLLREVEDAPEVVLDETTVEIYGQRLVEAARLLDGYPLTSNRVDRAESFHYLLLMTAYAVESAITNHDPLHPMWTAPGQSHLLDWGAASPDGVYRRATIRDDCSYRMWGQLGNAPYLSMDFRQSNPAVTLARSDFDVDSEGNFEFFVGGEPRDGPWLPLQPGTTGIAAREFFDDWRGAKRSRFRIECLDSGTISPSEWNAGRVAACFDVVSDWILEASIRFWMKKSTELAEIALNSFRPELARTETKLPAVTSGLWQLAPDEVLVIEFPGPEADFWGLQLASSLWHTLDYANRFTSINQAQMQPEPNGMCRVVLSHRDPGLYNWLDTMGLECGLMIIRFCGAAKASVPKTRLLKAADVGDELRDARRCSSDERHVQRSNRREGVAHMVCD